MKFLLSFVSAFVFLCAGAQTDSTVKFQELTHSFGKIKQHVPVTTEFTFTNNTAKTVIIEVATAECGCTTPEYPKAPIMKGKTGTIKVTYNAEELHGFKKTITVKFANIATPTILTIDGEVETSK